MTTPDSFDYHPAEIRPEEGCMPVRYTAGAFLIQDGRVLLEKRPEDARVYPGLWDTPGGHVEVGELPETALLREMKEELGIEAERFILGMVQDDHDPRTGTFYRHFIYIVRKWAGEAASREGRRIQWFPIAEALDLESLNPLIGFALEDFSSRGWMRG
jgi:8-oxo-dGTP diphosphatase